MKVSRTICLDAMKDSVGKEGENLTQHFIYFLEWWVSQLQVNNVLQSPRVVGPLLLSIGAVAAIAERCKDANLYSQLCLTLYNFRSVTCRLHKSGQVRAWH
jgi:hypothetical protein